MSGLNDITKDILNRFEIDETKTKYEHSLKPIPPEWLGDIIKENVNSFKVNVERIIANNKEKTFTIVLENNITQEEFDQKFNSTLFNTINNYIKNKEENPKHYNRGMVISTSIDGRSIVISY